MSREVEYHNITVNDDGFDCALVLSVRLPGDMQSSHEVRIAVEDIPDFMQGVVRHSAYALQTAASRIEIGHCETCANTGLVDTEVNGRKSNEYCPDCRDRKPSQPFKNAPKIGRREKV